MAALYLPLLFSASALLITIVSFLFFKSYLKHRTGQERILTEFRQEVNSILKTIDETTDRDISLLEDREKRLKNLLAEVDKRLILYIREMEQHTKIEKAHAALPALEKKSAPTYEALGKKRLKSKISEEEAPKPEPKPESPPPPVSPPPSTGEQIRSLMRSGLTDAAIASRLGISIAEVEFVAALQERRQRK